VLLQLRVPGFSLLQDGNIGIGVFPEGEEVSVGDVALARFSTRNWGLARQTGLYQELYKSRIRPKTIKLRINANHSHVP
jgi:hypothetical protein